MVVTFKAIIGNRPRQALIRASARLVFPQLRPAAPIITILSRVSISSFTCSSDIRRCSAPLYAA